MTSIQGLISPLPRPVRRLIYRTGYYIENRAHPSTDVYIISYPKTGRTWLRVLIGKAIADYANLDEKLILNTPKLMSLAGLPITRFTHDDASLNAAQHYQTLEEDKARFKHKRVIFLARDPRDTVVSCYFQATRRINQFEGSISEFIRDERLGIKKYVRFAKIWYASREKIYAFLPVFYEAMHNDTERVLRNVLDFIGAALISDELVRHAVAYGSFASMKQMEAGQQFQEARMQPGDAVDPESYKVRKGTVGGYREYLNTDDIAYIDGVIEKMGYPFPIGTPEKAQ